MTQYPKKQIIPECEEFRPEAITGKGVGEQRLILHRRNCRLYYLYLPSETREMVYVENFFETHWLKNARFIRRNVPWPSVEFIRRGSLQVESPDWAEPQTVREGSLLWIPAVRQAILRTGPDGFCQKVSLTVSGILLPDWQLRSGFDLCRILPDIDRKRFELLMEDFRRISGQQSEDTLQENSLLSWKLLQFLRNPFPKQQIPERFQKLPEKLKQNLDRPISLEELAADARCTKVHLVRAFRKYFGETPYRMLRNMRMRLAANMLLNSPELSIKEIAAQVGYENALTFSAEFRRYHGESPRGFRACSGRSGF